VTEGDALTVAAAQPLWVPNDITANASSHADVIHAANARVPMPAVRSSRAARSR
jgi:hypothetical protein